MKLVISTIPMKANSRALRYPVDGNSRIEYDGEVLFPVNGVLARTLGKREKARILLLVTRGEHSGENVEKFKEELQGINAGIGAELSFETLTFPFEPNREVCEGIVRDLISRLDRGDGITADITFGPKPLAIGVCAVLTFAEKFFDAKIEHVIYAKVRFEDNTPRDPMIYDLTPLHYLNKLIGAMECRSPEDAVKILEVFLSA